MYPLLNPLHVSFTFIAGLRIMLLTWNCTLRIAVSNTSKDLRSLEVLSQRPCRSCSLSSNALRFSRLLKIYARIWIRISWLPNTKLHWPFTSQYWIVWNWSSRLTMVVAFEMDFPSLLLPTLFTTFVHMAVASLLMPRAFNCTLNLWGPLPCVRLDPRSIV